MAAFTVPQDTRLYAGDTKYFHAALRNWQERNHDSRTFLELSLVQQSEILRDAQDLKAQTRAWYELQAALAASRRSQ
jgi:hypothetical protein